MNRSTTKAGERLFLIYPSVSRTILQMLYCKQLDEGDAYLLADLR